MNAKQIEAIELLVMSDLNKLEIAEKIGIHRNTLNNWLNNDDFIKTRDGYVKKQLDASVGKALRTMVGLLDSTQDNVRYSAAKDILDRTGYKPTDRIEHSGQPSIQVVIKDDIKGD